MKAFITGGAGFIGSNMVGRLLEDGAERVTVFDNFCSGKASYIAPYRDDGRFKLVEGDLLDLDLLARSIEGHDTVFHFAANPDIAKSMVETDLDLRLGIVATYNVLESMRRTNVRRIAYASGSGVYGDVGETETAEDFGPLLPISMYGASKLGAEGLISAFSHMFDMQAWIFRFANVVGRHQTHGVGYDFIRKLTDNPKALEILGDGTQSKSYIHVVDVLDAMLFVLKNTAEGMNVYNAASGDYITVEEIARIVTDEMNLGDVQFEYTGGPRGWKGDVPVVRFDTQKIERLGWQPSLNSSQAIRRSIKELLEEL